MKRLIITVVVAGMTVMSPVFASNDTPESNTLVQNKMSLNERIRMSQLPKDAQNYLKENYPIRSIQSITRSKGSDGKAMYEVAVRIEGNTTVLKFDSKGEFIDPTLIYVSK